MFTYLSFTYVFRVLKDRLMTGVEIKKGNAEIWRTDFPSQGSKELMIQRRSRIGGIVSTVRPSQSRSLDF